MHTGSTRLPKQEWVKYFEWREKKNRIYFNRFPEQIDFKDKKVLNIGSGHGALSFYVADRGAQKVIGCDIDADSVDFANTLKKDRFPQHENTVIFEHKSVGELSNGKFDIALSQAVFEHVQDIPSCLSAISERMNIGGKFYLGLGPLYRSPFGDHKFIHAPFQKIFPWAHLCFSDEWLIKHYNQKFPNKSIGKITDLGLNKYHFYQYIKSFNECDLTIKYLAINASKNPFVHIFNFCRRIPGLLEYFTLNIYVVFEKS